MGSIQVLPESISAKIAAGEVIERPASVVKELVENSIDAGATQVIVEVSSSGAGLIRVTDNGCGMTAEDTKLAFLRHATSKIKEIDDLWELQTMGFRGEALPSIAAVARVTMVTKSAADSSAVRRVIEGGEVKEVSETGAPGGTLIEIRDLFYNTPARRKFMKSETTEFGHIAQIVTQLALAHPFIDFRFRRQGKAIFEVPVTDDPKGRIQILFGREIHDALISLEEKYLWGAVKGWICGPQLYRNNRADEYYFVNRRAVTNRSLSHAAVEGYHTLLPSRQFPILFLFLEVDPKIVDVNVHPAKREVKFHQESRIHDDVALAIRKTLQQKPAGVDLKPIPADYSRENQVREAVEGYFGHADTLRGRNVFGTVGHTAEVGVGFKPAPTGPESSLEIPTARKIKVLCQIQNTYIVAEDEKGLLIYDQHTVHERIRYERLVRQFETAKLESQPLLFPETVEVTPRERGAWEENQTLFEKAGFEIELFGENSVIIRSAPAVLNQTDLKKFLRDLLSEIIFLEKGNARGVPDQMLKTMACRSAVMAGEPLDKSQLQPLVDQLQSVQFPQTCPHGRPTTWRIAWEEVAKRFQRQ